MSFKVGVKSSSEAIQNSQERQVNIWKPGIHTGVTLVDVQRDQYESGTEYIEFTFAKEGGGKSSVRVATSFKSSMNKEILQSLQASLSDQITSILVCVGSLARMTGKKEREFESFEEFLDFVVPAMQKEIKKLQEPFSLKLVGNVYTNSNGETKAGVTLGYAPCAATESTHKDIVANGTPEVELAMVGNEENKNAEYEAWDQNRANARSSPAQQTYKDGGKEDGNWGEDPEEYEDYEEEDDEL